MGCDERGEVLKAESSVSRRLVGVREDGDVDEVEERLFGADIVLRRVCVAGTWRIVLLDSMFLILSRCKGYQGLRSPVAVVMVVGSCLF